MTDERRDELRAAAETVAAVTDLTPGELVELIWLSMPGFPIDPKAEAEMQAMLGNDKKPTCDWHKRMSRTVSGNAHDRAPERAPSHTGGIPF